MMKLKTVLVLFSTWVIAAAAVADEGLWMPQQIPALGDELKRLGLQLDPPQFADLTAFPMGAVVQVGGCSASFVSPEGLLATNHHCVHGALQYNSTPENDLVRNGFLAKDRSQEIHASPDARAYVTTGVTDVTSRILAPFPRKASETERWRLIGTRRRQLINECQKPGGLRCQVASFYGGAQYLQITQMEIRDVRLVYAPARSIGNFGDEIDNWMWPRHTGDFAFYRAYVAPNGKPADHATTNVPYRPKHHLKISTRDLDVDDLVMVAGFPGRTQRHAQVSEVENAQQFDLPTAVLYREMLLDVLHARGKDDRAIALANASRIASLENYLKKYRGTLEAYRRDDIVAATRRQADEILANLPEANIANYRTALAQLNSVLEEQRATQQRDTVLSWLYTASPMLAQANRIYRLSLERAKPDLQRDEEYTEANRARLLGTIARSRRSIEPGSDRAGLRIFLLEAARLPADQRIPPVDAALAATGKSSPEAQVDALLDRIYASTRIGDAAAEQQMVTESAKQLHARNDSMIEFAASFRPFADQLDDLRAARSYRMIAPRVATLEALRTARGGRLYPDANSTLRVGFGQVKGYSPRDAVWYMPQTDVRGIVQKDTGEEPFDTPPQLLARVRDRHFGAYEDPELKSVPVDFISTNVVTNGSSGSATLNAWGELCGLAFDSNWEGVGSDYYVAPEITRTISVDSRYMLWVMDAVDGAHNLLREMGVEPKFVDRADQARIGGKQ